MNKTKNMYRPMLITSLVVGTLDGVAAVVMYLVKTEKDPLNVFRFIASGIFGPVALSGGVPMALWGILLHYSIAAAWTILFFWLADRVAYLKKNWIVSGVIYGMLIWLVMNRIVLPLSLVAMKAGPKEWTDILQATLVLIVCVGLPVSYAARKIDKRSK